MALGTFGIKLAGWRGAAMAAAAVFVGGQMAEALADDQALFSKLSDRTNAVVVVRVGQILESPRAGTENWGAQHATGFANGAVLAPPGTDVLVLGARVRPGHGAEAEAAAVIRMKADKLPEMAEVAKRQKGRLEYLAKQWVVYSPRYGYVVPFGENVFGVTQSTDRQDVVRWIQDSKAAETPGLSEYLMQVLAKTAQDDVVWSLDVEHMVSPDEAAEWLARTDALKGDAAGQKATADLLAGLKGMRMTVDVGAKTEAVVTLDFSTPVLGQADMLKKLFVEWVAYRGAMLEEFNEAQASAEGTTLKLTTTLSDDSFRRMLSLIQLPAHTAPKPTLTAVKPPNTQTPVQPVPPPLPGDQQTALDASRNYYQSVTRLVRDLSAMADRSNDYTKTALWHDNYAQRIDQLDMNDVDPALIDYGYRMSTSLRSLAESLRGVPMQVNQLESQKWSRDQYIPGVTVRYGAFGYVPGTAWNTNNYQEIQTKQAEAVAAGAQDRQTLWTQIKNDTQAVRRDMQKKYNVDFDAK